MSSKNSTAVGAIVAILIIGAVATLGYYQFEVAPGQNASTSTSATSSTPSVDCTATPSKCVNVTIISGASGCSPPTCTSGSNALYGYDPLSVTVVIGVNNTVVWTNKDSAFHTATEVTGPSSASFPSGAMFDTGCLDGVGSPCPQGLGSGISSYQLTFTVAGVYTYHCSYHSWMMGKITVIQGTGSITSTTSASTGSSSATSASSTSSGTSVTSTATSSSTSTTST